MCVAATTLVNLPRQVIKLFIAAMCSGILLAWDCHYDRNMNELSPALRLCY